tara:strand:- start:2160 stop:2477 length:318 start_codon:yes stop_codon:yes gene_type:complete
VKTYIHVNQHKIKANLKNNADDPVITVKQGKKNTYCHSVKILGDSVVRYSETGKPILSCGARVVIETQAEVIAECRKLNTVWGHKAKCYKTTLTAVLKTLLSVGH